MKLMKILILLFFGFQLIYATSAMAAKLAPFPSSASLQPIPVFTHPNVSGNVNHTGIKSTDYQNTNAPIVNNSNASNTETETKSSYGVWFWFSIWLAILSLFFALVLTIKRKK